jgi:hypothetical protein
VLKKKRECEREEKEGGTREGYRQKGVTYANIL